MTLAAAVIGYGYWGSLVARRLQAGGAMQIKAVCDRDPRRADAVRAHLPDADFFDDHNELFAKARIDAAIVATPARSHYEIACAAVAAGKHVLVEKPMTGSSDEAWALVDAARAANRLLMVDHTYLYSEAVRYVIDATARNELGNILYYDSVRTNLGSFRSDVDVIWDLASHDLAIVDALFREPAETIQATGFARAPGSPLELGYVTLRWGSRRIAHCHVSWLTPIKVRRTFIGGVDAMIEWDDLDLDARIRVHHGDADIDGAGADAAHRMRVGTRRGRTDIPLLSQIEPLTRLCAHFVECIETGARPMTDGESGARVVEWLEAADQSCAAGGAPVPPASRRR
jgi:predicted dehydrogenase